MRTTKGIASLLLCTGAGALLGAAPEALQSQTGLTQNPLPVEVQLLDVQLAPVPVGTVTVNGDSVSASGLGRYVFELTGPAAHITIDLHERGMQPIEVKIPLQTAPRVKSVYVEISLDPATGRLMSVLQKPIEGGAVDAPVYGRVGAGARVPFTSQQSSSGPPANDDCANASAIGDGATAFSTLGATTDGPSHASCQFDGQTYEDIWYLYTATCTGDLLVSTCDNADYDTDLVVYDTDDCGALAANLLGCNDDQGGCAGFTSEVEVPVVSGNDYLIRVGGFSSGDEGTGTLTITCTPAAGPPANDDCANAESIACNSTATFDNSQATSEGTDPDFSCKFNGAGPGAGSVWYTFVATTTQANLNTNLSTDGDDSLIAVYDGTCGNFTELACSEDEGVGLLSDLTVNGLTIGTTYYVQVAAFSDGARGEYVLELNCTTPIANDECDDAIDVGALPASVLVDNTGATDDIPSGEECGVASGPFNNVWYSFTGTGDLVRVTTCRAGTTNPDTKVSVFCGTCDDLTCVDGNDDNCALFAPFFQSTVDICTQAGVTYYVTVGDFSSSSGSGPIQLDIVTMGTPCTPTVFCTPIGACCLPDGSCEEIPEADCDAMGGDYQGDDTACQGEAVGDGGFENGPFGGVWLEGSSTFGTPICSVGACGTGGGTPPFAGTFWCWFGGISGVVEVGFLDQAVTIPVGSDTLEFYLDIPVSSGNGVDFMDVTIDATSVFFVLENDVTYAGGGWQLVSVDISGFDDGGVHNLRFDSTTTGTGLSPTNFFIDDVSIPGAEICKTCVVLDFETEDDGVTPLVNGQDISTPPEFGNLVEISASTISQGPAIFDTDPAGPNQNPQGDPDLLIDKGNVLIFQEVPGQTVPGIFDDPDDSSAGGTFFFDFTQPVEVRSLVLADIDLYPLPQDAFVTLIDSSFNTRTYHAPSGWTEDITIDGGTGYRTLDTTTLAPQPGFVAAATAVEDPGFDPCDVVRMEVSLTSSGAVDDIEICANGLSF